MAPFLFFAVNEKLLTVGFGVLSGGFFEPLLEGNARIKI